MSVELLEAPALDSPPDPATLTHAEAIAFLARGPDVPTLSCTGALARVRVTPHLSRYRCADCAAELTVRGGFVVAVDYRKTVKMLVLRLSARQHLKPEPPEYVLLGREDDPVAKRPMWD